MLTLMVFKKESLTNNIILLLFLLLSIYSAQCKDSTTAEDMNLFRYSAKRLTKKMSPSVSAVLMECPKTSSTPTCQRKIMVNIRVSPNDQTYRKEKYLLLDEVFDQRKQTRAKLMSPYLIELTQGEPVLMYPLEFVKNLECKSCDKPQQAEDVEEMRSMKPEIKSEKKINQNSDRPGSKVDLIKNLQALSKHLPKPSFKSLRSSLSHNPAQSSADDDEKDTNVDIDIALNDENMNTNDLNENPQVQRSDASPYNERNTKRNPKNAENLLFESNDYEEANRNYDEMFEELDRKNEKIKQDILDLLRPSLQITDADLKVPDAPRSREVANQTNTPPQLQSSCSCNGCPQQTSDTKCPPCPPCPTCPPNQTPTQKPKFEDSEGPITHECCPYKAGMEMNRFQPGIVNMPQQQPVNRPQQQQGVLGPRMVASLYGLRHGGGRGHGLKAAAFHELANEELPFQEFSDDSSSNSDDTEAPTSNNDFPSNGNVINEESEDIFSSVDEANDDFMGPNKDRQSNANAGNSRNSYSNDNKPNGNIFQKPFMSSDESNLENDIEWENPLAEPPEVSKFKKYHLDPINYGEVGPAKVNRYQSLLGRKALKGSPLRYSGSKLRKNNQKKEASFISYSNGFGLNVDVPDVSNTSAGVAFDHQPPMPKLHHYYMHLEGPPCQKCGENPAPLSSIANMRQMHQAPKKDSKKSIPRMCPFGKSFPFLRQISTSKLNPVRKISYSPGQAELTSHQHLNVPDYVTAKLTTGDDKQEMPENPNEVPGKRQESDAAMHQNPYRHGMELNPFKQSSKAARLNVNGHNSQKEDYESEEDVKSNLPLGINSKSNFAAYRGGVNSLSNLLTKQFKEKTVRDNSQDPVVDEDGDDYDYYEEDDSSDLSGFPNVVVSQSKQKFPSVFQRPVYVPEIPLESEDGSQSYCNFVDQPRLPFQPHETDNGLYDWSFEEEFDGNRNMQQQQQRKAIKRARSQHREDVNGYNEPINSDNQSPVQVLLSQEDQTMLPDKGPYEDFMLDPHLNTKDKMGLIELIDPHDVTIESLLKYLENEVQNSASPYYITKHDRAGLRRPGSSGSRYSSNIRGHEKNIEKRSYAMYDDLEMRDADVDYEGLTAARHVPAYDSPREVRRPHLHGRAFKSADEKDPKKSVRSIDDIWYSVFNMSAPLQFLTTRVRIFRKKGNSWWRIAPSITLTSLSGIYANANLSILFSSHVEIYNLEKPINLNNYKLLIPKNHTNVTGKDILAINKRKFHLEKLDNDPTVLASICEASNNQIIQETGTSTNIHKRSDEDDKIHSLQDMGEFPTRMNILEECKNDSSHLCLNMLDEDQPGYRMKVEIPFRDNSLVYKDYFKARITSITADATILGAVQIAVTFINEALITHGLDILIADCPVTCGEKNVVHKISPPHRGLTVGFLLPVAERDSGISHNCEVQIRTVSNQIISRRHVIVQPTARCLCIWQCNCQCFKETVSTSISNMCSQMSMSDETSAGFLDVESKNWTWQNISIGFAIFLIILLLLGCIKACLGCCLAFIGHWKYDYLQPMKKYNDASRPRRFFINSMFFLCFPFVCLCHCFQPNEEDMLQQTPNWEYAVKQKSLNSSEFDSEEEEEEESKENLAFTQKDTRSAAGEASGQTNAYANTVQEYLFESYNDEEEQQDADYVMNALHESKESVQKMDRHYSDEALPDDEFNAEATEFVRSLLEARIVYRTFKIPIGNAELPPGQAFSIRGYFIPSIGPGYQFITHNPLRQHWRVCPDIRSLRPVRPPIVLLSKDFSRSYANKLEVLQVGDLSVCPYINAPCINVLVQDISMYVRPDLEDEDDEYDDEPYDQD